MIDTNLTPIIENSFLQFAGAVLQSRALVDVRDCLKPSARQIFYCMETDGFVHSKPFQKTLKSIGSCFRLYIHGDSSAEGVIMRAGQPFAMRYPLVEVEGSYGTLLASGSWAAPRYCLTGDALVSTDKGLIRIKDIVNSEENSDNKIPTLTCRGAFGLTTTNLIFNSGLQQTYKLTLKNGIQISGTPNHPILTLNDKFEFIWKTIDELGVGDKILLNVRNNFLYGEENDVDYAKALGCLISEGCLTIENRINMINSDLDMIMPVQNLLHKYGSKANYSKRNQEDDCYTINTTNQILYKKLKEDNCAYDSYHKHIPNSVFKGTREYQKEFIRYLFEGDGCISIHGNGYGVISYSSVSEDLIRELQILLLSNFGIVSYITLQKKKKEIKLEMGGEDMYLFCKNIGFVSNRKNDKAELAIAFYEENRKKKSTGSRGWRIFPEIRSYLAKYYPEAKLIINRKDRPNECKGPLMSKDGLEILKEKLPYETYSKIEFIYRNFISIPIIQKEDNGLQVVYSPKINEGCNSFTANGIINHNTSARLSKLAEYLFADLKKDTISEWRDNYDNTEQYPAVLPSKGFYNLVNGTFGLGVGASSSIPQYNIKQLNDALIYLIDNPNCDFDDIYIEPDFATGATIINGDQVKESHRKGNGCACKIRSTVEWDSKDRCFVVTEIPFMVYTETICKELEEIINGEENPGIERFNDLTGKNPLIKIYLSKKANPDKILRFLYKNTSLESYYGINFTMLDKGRFPKVFTWKEMLQAHIGHEREVYRKGFEFDLRKITARLHIIEGLKKAYNAIDEVVQTIKQSASSQAANSALQKLLSIDEIQAKAILDLKLSRLSKIDINKLLDEERSLEKEKEKIEEILGDEKLLNEELKKGWREVAEKFGDARRTKVLNLLETEEEPIEKKQLSVSFTNFGATFVTETSTLYTQRRKGVGAKFKLDKGEYIVDNLICENTDTLLFFTKSGHFYHFKASELSINDKQYLPYSDKDIVAAAVVDKTKPNIIFVTKKGYIKKSLMIEYNVKRKLENGSIAIKLEEDDEIVSISFVDNEQILILSNDGHMVRLETSNITTIGRNTRGVIAMKLAPNAYVAAARLIQEDSKEVVIITDTGYTKKIALKEFQITNRNTKGVKIGKSENYVDFIIILNQNDFLITSTQTQIRIKYEDVPQTSRGAQGVTTIKLSGNSSIIKIEQV